MDCPKCANTMVKAKATDFGEDYDYCRTCKKELKELQPKKPSAIEQALLDAKDTLFGVNRTVSIPVAGLKAWLPPAGSTAINYGTNRNPPDISAFNVGDLVRETSSPIPILQITSVNRTTLQITTQSLNRSHAHMGDCASFQHFTTYKKGDKVLVFKSHTCLTVEMDQVNENDPLKVRTDIGTLIMIDVANVTPC